jgi:hypothetical protein
MVYFQNKPYDLFNKEYGDKKIICFGGWTLRLFLLLQQANIDLIRRIKES